MRTAKQRLEEEPMILEAEEEGALVGLNVMPLKSGSIAAVDGDLDSEGTKLKLGISDWLTDGLLESTNFAVGCSEGYVDGCYIQR